MTPLDVLWDKLRRVQSCQFTSRSNSALATGWSGEGSGDVTVESPAPTILLFHEAGLWYPTASRHLRFHNVFRWTRQDESLRLEHLRFGQESPVYLFDLIPAADGTWSSLTPHLCREDTYSARLREESDRLFLAWAVLGPKKDEVITYTYSTSVAAPTE